MGLWKEPPKKKVYTRRSAIKPIPVDVDVVHQLKEMKGQDVVVKCRTGGNRPKWSGWQSEVTCESCLA